MSAGARSSLLWLAALAAGCGGSLKVATQDAAPGADGGLAAFCTGDAPRMVVNGVVLTPKVSAYPIVMDCCDGGGLELTNDVLPFAVGFGWVVMASPTYTLPATIDLAGPPEGWSVAVTAGCRMTAAGCVSAADEYRSGLVGWFTVARDAGARIDMSVCVHVEEDPAEPAYLLGALDLYVPHAVAN